MRYVIWQTVVAKQVSRVSRVTKDRADWLVDLGLVAIINVNQYRAIKNLEAQK